MFQHAEETTPKASLRRNAPSGEFLKMICGDNADFVEFHVIDGKNDRPTLVSVMANPQCLVVMDGQSVHCIQKRKWHFTYTKDFSKTMAALLLYVSSLPLEEVSGLSGRTVNVENLKKAMHDEFHCWDSDKFEFPFGMTRTERERIDDLISFMPDVAHVTEESDDVELDPDHQWDMMQDGYVRVRGGVQGSGSSVELDPDGWDILGRPKYSFCYKDGRPLPTPAEVEAEALKRNAAVGMAQCKTDVLKCKACLVNGKRMFFEKIDHVVVECSHVCHGRISREHVSNILGSPDAIEVSQWLIQDDQAREVSTRRGLTCEW